MTRARFLLRAAWVVFAVLCEVALVVLAFVAGWNGHYAEGTFALAIVIAFEVMAIHNHVHRDPPPPMFLMAPVVIDSGAHDSGEEN